MKIGLYDSSARPMSAVITLHYLIFFNSVGAQSVSSDITTQKVFIVFSVIQYQAIPVGVSLQSSTTLEEVGISESPRSSWKMKLTQLLR